jgi:hypothetical protein
MFKVERKSPKAEWYEVMLSPFKSMSEALSYIEQYSKYYPDEDKNYRITNDRLDVAQKM